ncbi:hypothetical protein THIOM_001796 [Candidatus Thiomargarita nelsonii]|uniref:Uncharacterized protein n=1 Tax=Candidatus Thiomargarita nelsonii TaxID=1003181 RepID=A0A176S2S3_9GAMM|nr:hypothetical protein THIOM_001796 [Candidatus Thiomargarita nelsonii]
MPFKSLFNITKTRKRLQHGRWSIPFCENKRLHIWRAFKIHPKHFMNIPLKKSSRSINIIDGDIVPRFFRNINMSRYQGINLIRPNMIDQLKLIRCWPIYAEIVRPLKTLFFYGFF